MLMQFQPVHALISREHDETFHDVPGMLPLIPEVGAVMQLFLDSGKVMRTSPVRHVAHQGTEWVVDTLNSQYRLKEIH